VRVKALAHLTGGGFYDNIPRVLPGGTGVQIDLRTWPVLPIFAWIQSRGQVATEEMYHVFNMGIGMVAILSAGDAEQALSLLPGDSYRLGRVVPSDSGPRVTLR